MVRKNSQNNYMPNNNPSDFQKEIVIWLRSIGVILFTYLCGFVWMGLSDHFLVREHERWKTTAEPQLTELYQMHKYDPHKKSPSASTASAGNGINVRSN